MLKLCQKCKDRLELPIDSADPEECLLCNGILWKPEEIARKMLRELGDYEFNTFLIGCRLEGSVKALEDYLFEEYGIGEDKSIKLEFNREVGKALGSLVHKTYSPQKPDITIIYNLETGDMQFEVRSLYIYGRYLKRVRDISQTTWLCRSCEGKGCEKCDYTGKNYYTSVEELIVEPTLEMTQGERGVLHGSGREDVDARMLGNGRPFILEIQEPRKRNLDLKELQSAINESAGGKVAVRELEIADSDDVKAIKEGDYRKTYRAKVEFEREVGEDQLGKALESISNRTIHQRTPSRVKHRRADMVRERNAYDIRLLLHRGNVSVIEIDAQSGLYIKELISGDEGRTTPNLSEVLNNSARVSRLDVIKIWDNNNTVKEITGR
ncbi:MAG: tRNA pseudouridine(54/55) synthase Pus10 [Archaeoglobaceae archaeon]